MPNRNEEGPRVYDVLRVYADCNRLGAAVAAGELLADGRLWIDGVGSTAKGCRPPRQAQDEWLTKFLVSNPAGTSTATNSPSHRPVRGSRAGQKDRRTRLPARRA